MFFTVQEIFFLKTLNLALFSLLNSSFVCSLGKFLHMKVVKSPFYFLLINL